MFWEFRKRILGYVIVNLIFGGMIVFCLIVGITNKSFVRYGINKVTTNPKQYMEIKAGENLSQYERKKISCKIKYVANHVINFYDRDDPNKEIYTCGYVALDDNMENPFCVFVPPSKREQMEALLNETWKIKQGESMGDSIEPITVQGYVGRANEKIYSNYLESLRELYGGDYALKETTVFYFDDGASTEGGETGDDMAVLLGLFAMLIIFGSITYAFVIIVKSSCFFLCIKKFISQNGISRIQLENEFKIAEEVAPNYWISPQYTFSLAGSSVSIIKNKDIVWCYEVNGLRRGLQRYVGVGTIGQERHKSGLLPGSNPNKVFQYYEENFPHIVTGNDAEKKDLFKHNFAEFLKLKYMQNINNG